MVRFPVTEKMQHKDEDQSAYESPCPNCHDIVDSREWVNGMYCPHCWYNLHDHDPRPDWAKAREAK